MDLFLPFLRSNVFFPPLSSFLPRGGSEFFFFLDRGSIRIEEEFFFEREEEKLFVVGDFICATWRCSNKCL